MNDFDTNIPLQDLIAGILKGADDKIAQEKEMAKKVDKLLAAKKKEDKEEEKEEGKEKAASLTDPNYVEKLASAVDYIYVNIDNIEKGAEGATIPPAVPAGDLKVTKSLDGPPPPHKSTKPAGGKDAANASGEALKDGGKASTTQICNDYDDVPGGPSGYPAKGVIVNGPKVQKTASIRDLYIEALEKKSQDEESYKEKMKGKEEEKKEDKKENEKEKKASQLKAAILRKLAGEDVFPANISAPKSASPLVGGGELKVDDASQPRSAPTGYGNECRADIQSNQAAINLTKGKAKTPQKKQLKEVLDEPALSRKTDPVLSDSWQSADRAGVKIAMDNAKALLLKVAEEGTPEQKEKLQAVLEKSGMNGAMASAPPPPPPPPPPATTSLASDGEGAGKCTCGGAGECRVCRLKAALSNAKGKK